MFLIAICNFIQILFSILQFYSNRCWTIWEQQCFWRFVSLKNGKKFWKRFLSCSCSRKGAWLYKANATFSCWWRNLSVKAVEDAGKQLADGARKSFNYRLSQACRNIENTFGILGSRCKIFQKPIEGTPKRKERIIPATVALYNYVNQTDHTRYSPTGFIDLEDGTGEIIGDGEEVSPTTF